MSDPPGSIGRDGIQKNGAGGEAAMCQLLGMNCNTPTDICFSFTGFQVRGGLTDQHRDGWGIAFFEGRGCRVFIDPSPSFASPIAELVRNYPIRSLNVIAHIRKATQGAVSLENTHPFMRELWGRYWIFAHNGDLKGLRPELDGAFLPAGTTDSERAFCLILQSLRRAFPDGEPPRETLFDALAELAREIGAHGDFNFLLSNGDSLWAHCSTQLAYIVRQAPFSEAHLKDQDVSVDFSELTTPEDRVAVIATAPLTDNEVWTPIGPGSLLMFHDGFPAALRPTRAAGGD
jgi:predicted glutamine amidotransferase